MNVPSGATTLSPEKINSVNFPKFEKEFDSKIGFLALKRIKLSLLDIELLVILSVSVSIVRSSTTQFENNCGLIVKEDP